MKSYELKKLMPKTESILDRRAQLEAIAWMNKSPHPMPVFEHDETVYVLQNNDWRKARVITSSQNGCQVQLIENKKAFNLYDARCIRPS